MSLSTKEKKAIEEFLESWAEGGLSMMGVVGKFAKVKIHFDEESVEIQINMPSRSLIDSVILEAMQDPSKVKAMVIAIKKEQKKDD